VTLKTALALSLNTATVRLAQKVGIHEVAAIAKRCGIRSRLDPYLSLALGSSDVTPLELTVAYTVFATGRKVEVITYDRIDTKNNIYYKEVLPRSQEVLSQEVVEQMREMLRAVVENGTAQKAKEISRMVYGKTGTTNSFSDAWFIGFDDRFVVGVWVGRDDHKPIGAREAGSRAALPIWIEFMKKIPDKGD
jgi:penicillin-binding protein 1A